MGRIEIGDLEQVPRHRRRNPHCRRKFVSARVCRPRARIRLAFVYSNRLPEVCYVKDDAAWLRIANTSPSAACWVWDTGVAATLAFGFTPVQGIFAAWLTGIGGMLPDLDSQSGRPVREIFGLTAAVGPLVMLGRVQQLAGLQGDTETMMVLFLVMYLAVKYGLAGLVGRISVHRGMFHSIPAIAIAAEIVYLGYPSDTVAPKALMAGGVAIGFFSHLLLDEVYSVQWSGVRIKLKKSAGSALKFFGNTPLPNLITYSLLLGLSYLMLSDAGIIGPPVEGTESAMQADLRDGSPSALDAAPEFGDSTPIELAREFFRDSGVSPDDAVLPGAIRDEAAVDEGSTLR